MGKKILGEDIEEPRYFETTDTAPETADTDEGTREMGMLPPFIISGGENTERYYFIHISNVTEYKFNIKPEYFSGESNYTEVFEKRITEIIRNNTDAKIFCVFDWDTIYGDAVKLKKHKDFTDKFKEEIKNGSVVICESMPCIEYWFLLHFTNYTKLLKTYSKVSQLLSPLKKCFPNQKIKLKKLLKKEEYLKDEQWVRNLCSEGKLENAIRNAEHNIKTAEETGDLENQSYTKVYKIFKNEI